MAYQSNVEYLLHHVTQQKEHVYLHQPVEGQWQTFTWGEVEQQARKIAAAIKSQNYPAKSRIGILSKNCAQWFIADLAIMMADMVSVPIFFNANEKSISHIIKHSELKAIFVGKLDELESSNAGIPEDVLRISFPYPTIPANANWQEWLNEFEPLDDIYLPKAEENATIIYTSGSTGVPKGVPLTHANIMSAAVCAVDEMKVKSTDRFMSYLPLAHITERSLIEGVSMVSGCSIYFVESLDTFIDNVKHAKPTRFISVPRLWLKFQSEILAKIPQRKLEFLLKVPFVGQLISKKIRKNLGFECVERFGSGSAPTPPSVIHWYQKLGICLEEGWGMSETSGLSCGNNPFSEQDIGTIGRPLSCVEMKLSDEDEILIRGEAVFSGYYLNPEADENAFADGWFRTGDRGEVTDTGAFKIIGRLKEEFKTSKGKYVTPAPIEGKLCASSNIELACVTGAGLKQPVALIVLAESANSNKEGLATELSQTLAEVNNTLERHQHLDYLYVCKDIWTIENGLLTPTLKIKRGSIEDKYGAILTDDLTPAGGVIFE
ncbi:AMP-binding protein [Thalassotalea sp. M1531]|uniref:AMP-binding protein n=1 Tax=Thalassotalea algicola TaxID=2716224 RepID=A0A7Y0LBH3_9GAMM|nr:AMP-binding protein [Thalassotalea algicola]NMP31133.1 AMP-binding protein [Thalassotalea algicola]